MILDNATKLPNTTSKAATGLNFDPTGKQRHNSVTAAITVMLWPEGMELAAVGG
jgi:hypothetical protein